MKSRYGSGGVWALEISKKKKNPFYVGFGGLFIGVGGWYFAQISGDPLWHVTRPARPSP